MPDELEITNNEAKHRYEAIVDGVTAFALYMHGFSGENGHKMNHGVTIGFAYGFRPRAQAVLGEEAGPVLGEEAEPALGEEAGP